MVPWNCIWPKEFENVIERIIKDEETGEVVKDEKTGDEMKEVIRREEKKGFPRQNIYKSASKHFDCWNLVNHYMSFMPYNTKVKWRTMNYHSIMEIRLNIEDSIGHKLYKLF